MGESFLQMITFGGPIRGKPPLWSLGQQGFWGPHLGTLRRSILYIREILAFGGLQIRRATPGNFKILLREIRFNWGGRNSPPLCRVFGAKFPREPPYCGAKLEVSFTAVHIIPEDVCPEKSSVFARTNCSILRGTSIFTHNQRHQTGG